MSKLKDLIAELCPNGVEFKSLGEVVNISKGVQFNKSDMQSVGSFPVINGGINPSGYIEKYNQAENTITVSQGGASAGYVNWISTKFWAGAHCYIVKPLDAVINRYVFHFLKSQEKNLQECQYGAGIPALSKTTIENLKIPVPPLEVQAEIVRILDTFTELTAKLTAELALRKKQYEYYRDKLLTFEDKSNTILTNNKQQTTNNKRVEFKTLGEIAIIKNGKDYKHLGQGKIPVYGSGGIMKYVDSFAYDKPTVLLPRKGSISNVFYVDTPFWNVDTIYYTEIDEQKIIPKFFYHFICNLHIEKFNTSNAARPALTQEVLNKILIPVPPLAEQERIVKILDKFDKLCNDLRAGLPAEIAARKKQYEYYRDKLLTFTEVKI